MELEAAIRGRRSIRSFQKKKLERKEVLEILELANQAPSAGNLQARDFIVVEDAKQKAALARAAWGQSFIAEAPIVVVVCANQQRSGSHYGARGRELYCIQDADAAIEHILLVAHARGLGTCWVGAFDERAARKVLNLPAYVRPVAIIPIGFPAEQPLPTPRLKLERLVHYDKWE